MCWVLCLCFIVPLRSVCQQHGVYCPVTASIWLFMDLLKSFKVWVFKFALAVTINLNNDDNLRVLGCVSHNDRSYNHDGCDCKFVLYLVSRSFCVVTCLVWISCKRITVIVITWIRTVSWQGPKKAGASHRRNWKALRVHSSAKDFVFYCWLSIGISIVNTESFKKFLDPDRDSDRHQNLVDCSLCHAPPLQKIIKICW